MSGPAGSVQATCLVSTDCCLETNEEGWLRPPEETERAASVPAGGYDPVARGVTDMVGADEEDSSSGVVESSGCWVSIQV